MKYIILRLKLLWFIIVKKNIMLVIFQDIGSPIVGTITNFTAEEDIKGLQDAADHLKREIQEANRKCTDTSE